MKIICAILGILLGVVITNALWLTVAQERAPLLTIGFITFGILVFAVGKDWEA